MQWIPDPSGWFYKHLSFLDEFLFSQSSLGKDYEESGKQSLWQ